MRGTKLNETIKSDKNPVGYLFGNVLYWELSKPEPWIYYIYFVMFYDWELSKTVPRGGGGGIIYVD